jgi:transcriptional regulator with XRE-family HTH domain
MSLRAWRHRKVLSIEDLAKAASVSNKTITDIEHGRVRPKFRTIRRLSAALAVDPGEVEEFARVLTVDGGSGAR